MSYNSASEFIERVNEIEKQRRLLDLKAKEYEAKATADEEEEKALIEKDAAMTEEENSLKKELDRLTLDLHHAQLQTANLESSYRHSECEEPLLHKIATERLEKSTAEESRWTASTHKIDAMVALWQKDEVVAKLQTEVNATQAELQKLLAEETALRSEIALYEGQIAAAEGTALTAGEGLATLAALDGAAAAANEDTAEGIEYLILKEEQEFQAEQVLVTRQLSALQREVDDMRCRATELEQLKEQLTRSVNAITLSCERAQHCLETGLCEECLAKEEAEAAK